MEKKRYSEMVKKGKGLNINIFYNINSKNITNNQQAELYSQPLHRNTPHEQPYENMLKKDTGGQKKKLSNFCNKKSSFDILSQPSKYDKRCSQLAKKPLTKSNHHSISSGLNLTNPSRATTKPNKSKKCPPQSKQKELNTLLNDYKKGSIDNYSIIKSIVKIFNSKEDDKKKDKRKKYTDSPSLNPSTPKNSQFSRLTSFAGNNMKNMHKMRKKQCKSQRGTFLKSRSELVHKNNFIDEIVEMKAIDSSLLLEDKDEEPQMGFTERVLGIQTSDSVKNLNKNIKTERQSFSLKMNRNSVKQKMAIKIQRAWRKYKTKKIIQMVLETSKHPSLESKLNDLNDELKVSTPPVEDRKKPSQYQSEQIFKHHESLYQPEKIKGEALRTQQISKWTQIMDYVKMNIENDEVPSQERLGRIINYFENAKKTVENQLYIEKGVMEEQSQERKPSYDLIELSSIQEIKESENKKTFENEIQILSVSKSMESNSEYDMIDLAQNTIENLRAYQRTPNKLNYMKNIPLETMQQALMNYSRRIDQEREEQLEEIDIYSCNFLKHKEKIDKKYSNLKRQIKKIIRNLNKGYDEVKNILNKSLNEQPSTVSRCKSDNYLLRTAINYKKYVEKMGETRQEEEPKGSILSSDKNSHNVSAQLEVKGGNMKLEDNIMSEELMQYDGSEKHYEQYSDQFEKKNPAQEISLFDNTKLNENNRKLKCLSAEDKEDIFEFLFIDLTIQLSNEWKKDSYIFSAINKYKEKLRRLRTIPRGIKTNLNTSKEYLSKIHQFIKLNYLQVFYEHIEVPMGPSASEMLRYMHEEDDDSNQENESVPLILPVIVFDNYEKKRERNYERFYEDDGRELARVNFLKSVEHIHNKSIFDCLNEWLDNERPYGIWGKPFPWKKHLLDEKWSKKKKQQKLVSSLQKTIQCASYLCGIIPDKEDSVFGNHKVSEYHLEQIRQDRVSKMLANDLAENEIRWVFYDDEQTQVLVEIGRHILKKVLEEATLEFVGIEYQREEFL